MQDLVDATGVNRASLYATYGDKRELFRASLKAYDEGVRGRLTQELAAKFPPIEAIRQLFLAFIDQVRQPGRNWGCMIVNTAVELAPHDPEVSAIVASVQSDLEQFFREQVERGQRLGEISPSLDVEKTARGLLASLLGYLVIVRSQPDEQLLAAIVEEVGQRLK